MVMLGLFEGVSLIYYFVSLFKYWNYLKITVLITKCVRCVTLTLFCTFCIIFVIRNAPDSSIEKKLAYFSILANLYSEYLFAAILLLCDLLTQVYRLVFGPSIKNSLDQIWISTMQNKNKGLGKDLKSK